jgi:serine/threonine protein kinase
VPRQPAEDAQYDQQTGAPVNITAKRDVARAWNTATEAGAKPQVVQLPFDILRRATDDFDAAFNRIGGGASCSVFTGRVFGTAVAVKMLAAKAIEWEAEQFEAESKCLGEVSHENICRLFAYSTDGPQHCLVLELCTGGALSERLACRASGGRAPPPPLTWRHRVRIGIGIARALEHLHTLKPQAMIHRCVCSFVLQLTRAVLLSICLLAPLARSIPHSDLKGPNVLLDDQGNAKVADFGETPTWCLQRAVLTLGPVCCYVAVVALVVTMHV